MLKNLIKDLNIVANPKKAKILGGFFKKFSVLDSSVSLFDLSIFAKQ